MKTLILSFYSLLFFVASAQANTAFYEDPKTGLRLSYPFEWRVQTSVPAAEILHIRAPHNQDLAQCKLDVIEDKRFIIYPRHIMGEIVNRELGEDYWETFVSRYQSPNILDINYNGGLGQGDATYANIEFVNNAMAPGTPMRGIYFASLYGDLNINFACFSKKSAFDQWKSIFLSIADTITFPQKYHSLANGHYRNFFADGVVYFETGQGQGSLTSY